jgi:ADP-ribosylation factor protein 1
MGSSFSQPQVRPETRVLILSLETAILLKLRLGEVVTTRPTPSFTFESVVHKNIQSSIWDVGKDKDRSQCDSYLQQTKARVFVIDSAAHDRFDEAATELRYALNAEALHDAVVYYVA